MALNLTILINLPAADSSRDHDQQDQDRHDWKAGSLDGSVRMNGSMLVCDDAGIGRSFVSGLQILGYSFVFVHPDALGIGANIGLVEDPTREQFELFFFESDEQAASDLGGGDDLIEGNTAHLALPTQMLAK